MKLSFEEREQRLIIATDLLEYAKLMDGMLREPYKHYKNIFREIERKQGNNEISEEKFKRIKKHHFFNGVVTAFSYIEEEYLDNLNAKDFNLDEKELESIFVNPADIDKFRNHSPGQNNALMVNKILKAIRNSLNHTENGVLYKYIEDEDAIEINLKNIGNAYDGSETPFHVKIKMDYLMTILEQLRYNDNKNMFFMILSSSDNIGKEELKEEVEETTKVIRIMSKDYRDYQQIINNIINTYDGFKQREKLEEAISKNLIKTREYTYHNGGISRHIINSIYNVLQNSEEDQRCKVFLGVINTIGEYRTGEPMDPLIKRFLLNMLSKRNILPFGVISSERYMSSLKFEKEELKTWNNSLKTMIEHLARKGLDFRNPYVWFLADPIEKKFTEYENFIRYSVINFPPYPNIDLSEECIVKHDFKSYNYSFIRNAFSHGRVGYVKDGNIYKFALYDTPKGLSNETNYYEESSFRPQLFTLDELTGLSLSLINKEKEKIIKDRAEVLMPIMDGHYRNNNHQQSTKKSK